jgi:hypothetical protein
MHSVQSPEYNSFTGLQRISMNRHAILSILMMLLALAIGNSTASAALMTFNYTATIETSTGPFDGIPAVVGDTVTGTFSYDPSNPNAGTVTFVEQGGFTLPSDPGTFHAFAVAGSFVETGSLNGGLDHIAFQLTPLVPFASLPPTLTPAQIASGLLDVGANFTSGSFEAKITSFSGGSPASVPEPASLTLMSLGGLLCAAVAARRRKRKPADVADAASIG